MPNVKLKYSNISQILHNALVVRVETAIVSKKYVPNVNLKYFNIAELLHNALVVMAAELL